MHVLIMGAGIIGVTSAWYLRAAGHEVTVVERQSQPAVETSFANGGQVSVSHAEPWANPSAPLKVLRWLFQDDAPLLFRPRLDPAQWHWCLSFLRECTASHTAHNIRQIVALGLYSRQSLGELRRELGLAYDGRQDGILHFYTDEAEYRAAFGPADIMRAHGCDIEMVSADEMVEIEPALRFARDKLVGGSMTRTDESGDACKFTRDLARHAAAQGVQFMFNAAITGLETKADKVTGLRVRCADGAYRTIRADAYVTCLGTHSRALLAPHGIDLAIYPAKGYSLTLPVRDESRAYRVSLTDDEYKLVFSRLGDRIRVAGTAELSGYNLDLSPVRCAAILRRTLELFPEIGDPAQAQYWTGLRPATPSNVPYIGRSRLKNLFLNTGHGTLGWTHACGSGRAIAAIVGGESPPIPFAFAA